MTTRSTDTVCGLATSVGHRRTRNENAALPGPEWFVVADGIGGHDHGHIASQLLAEAVLETQLEQDDVGGPIATAVDSANRSILRAAARRRSPGMGTTLVVDFGPTPMCRPDFPRHQPAPS